MTRAPRFDATHDRSLGFALGELVRLIRRDFLAQARSYELTPELWRLLYCLDREQGCSQAHLATVLDVTTVTLGRMVDSLEKRGLVRRAAHPTDRRTTCLYLTKAAARPIARMHELVDDNRQRAMRGLSARDQDQLWRLIGKLRENLLHSRPPAAGTTKQPAKASNHRTRDVRRGR